jgi:hypothetical protein
VVLLTSSRDISKMARPVETRPSGRLASGVAAAAHALALAITILLGSPASAASELEGPSSAADSVASESLMAPARRGNYPFANAEAFVFGGDGTVVGGAMGLGYVGSAPFRAELGMQDLAVAMSNGETESRVLLLAYAGLDTHLFGFGPNVGYLFGQQQLRMPVLGATLRIGASDGLHAQTRVNAGFESVPTVRPAQGPPAPEEKRVALAELDLRLQVPIARGGHALVAALDVSHGPLARVAFGYRTCLSSVRQRDSSWIEIKAGLGLMDTTSSAGCSDCQVFSGGPLLSVAFEQRF